MQQCCSSSHKCVCGFGNDHIAEPHHHVGLSKHDWAKVPHHLESFCSSMVIYVSLFFRSSRLAAYAEMALFVCLMLLLIQGTHVFIQPWWTFKLKLLITGYTGHSQRQELKRICACGTGHTLLNFLIFSQVWVSQNTMTLAQRMTKWYVVQFFMSRSWHKGIWTDT